MPIQPKSVLLLLLFYDLIFTGNSPSLTDDVPPETEFHFFQEIDNLVRVLVLDTSGSMNVSLVT